MGEGTTAAPMRSNRAWIAGVAGVVAAGVVVRVVYVLVVLDDVPSGLDSIWYQLQGGSIRDGTGYVVPTTLFTGEYTPTAAFPPLYPAYQALWQMVFDAGPASVRLAGVVPATAAVILTALLGHRVVGAGVGLAAAAAVAIHPGLVAADGSAMSENLTVPLTVAAQLLALRFVDSGRRPVLVVLGPVLGLAVLTRQDLLFLGLILVIWIVVVMPGSWRDKTAAGALVAVGAAVVIAPWLVRNSQAVDTIAVSTLSPTSAVAGANCASTYRGPDVGSWDYDCVVAARPSEASEREVGELGLTERDLMSAYQAAAVDHIRHNLGRVPLVVAAREARAWSLWDPRDLARRDAEESRRYGWQVRARPLEAVFALVGAVGLAALVRRNAARALVLVAPVIAVVVSVALGYGNPRFNVIAQPSLAIGVMALAGDGVARLRRRGSARLMWGQESSLSRW
jgi:Dolichyl-phosphate-mannose-protein mannosyltransferase